MYSYSFSIYLLIYLLNHYIKGGKLCNHYIRGGKLCRQTFPSFKICEPQGIQEILPSARSNFDKEKKNLQQIFMSNILPLQYSRQCPSQSILETGIQVWDPKNEPKKFHQSKKCESVIVLKIYFRATEGLKTVKITLKLPHCISKTILFFSDFLFAFLYRN